MRGAARRIAVHHPQPVALVLREQPHEAASPIRISDWNTLCDSVRDDAQPHRLAARAGTTKIVAEARRGRRTAATWRRRSPAPRRRRSWRSSRRHGLARSASVVGERGREGEAAAASDERRRRRDDARVLGAIEVQAAAVVARPHPEADRTSTPASVGASSGESRPYCGAALGGGRVVHQRHDRFRHQRCSRRCRTSDRRASRHPRGGTRRPRRPRTSRTRSATRPAHCGRGGRGRSVTPSASWPAPGRAGPRRRRRRPRSHPLSANSAGGERARRRRRRTRRPRAIAPVAPAEQQPGRDQRRQRRRGPTTPRAQRQDGAASRASPGGLGFEAALEQRRHRRRADLPQHQHDHAERGDEPGAGADREHDAATARRRSAVVPTAPTHQVRRPSMISAA